MTATGPTTLPFGETARTVEDAFAICERLARTHYENFSLGTRLLPADLRPHFYSVYAFCRGVDDLGDEVAGDRAALLDSWEAELRACYAGEPRHPYFMALQTTIAEFDIPQEPFLRLIEANRRDQTVNRYPDFDSLLDYCDHSADPVGRIVLYVFGHREPELHELSDHTCTALQLTNFWQDVARDYAMDRIYLPESTMQEFGTSEDDIAAGTATPGFRAALKYEVERARGMFRDGTPLIERVVKPARVDIALFTAGGLAVLRTIERQDYDVLSKRPSLGKLGKARLFVGAYLRSRLGLTPLPASAAG